MSSTREEFTLMLEWCQRLTETCLHARANFPKKWGEKPVSEDDQLLGREDLGELFKVLRSYSPWLQGIGDDYKVIFGEKAEWYPIGADGKRQVRLDPGDERISGWKMENPQKMISLRLNREALSGAVWCCILRLHTYPTLPTGTRDAVETWWPLADALGRTTAIKKYIGIAGAKRVHWEEDAPEAEKDKK